MRAQQLINVLLAKLSYKFVTIGVVNMHKAKKQYMQNKCCDVLKLKYYYINVNSCSMQLEKMINYLRKHSSLTYQH